MFKNTGLLMFLLCVCHWTSAQKKITIFPSSKNEIVHLKGKGSYAYSRLEAKKPITLELEGPGELFLNIRSPLRGASQSSPMGQIKLVHSSKRVETLGIPELKKGHLYSLDSAGKKERVSKRHRISIHVPPGKHRYKFYLQQSSNSYLMRSFFSAKPKPQWEDVPAGNGLEKKLVRFKKNDKIRTYYRLAKRNVMELDVGPDVYYRIIVRPEFTYSMLDETVVKMRLENLDSGEYKIYKFHSKRSASFEYPNDMKNTPGRSSIIYMQTDLPSLGAGRYALSLQSGAKAVNIRVSKDQQSHNQTSLAKK